MEEARASLEAETDIVGVIRKLRLHTLALKQLLPSSKLDKLKLESEFKAIDLQK